MSLRTPGISLRMTSFSALTAAATAVAAVSELVATAGDEESVLIYPEGTRFTQAKHDALGEKRPQLREQLERWPSLLPLRLGGVSAMLANNPGKDLVFLAHVGFEGSANVHDLLGGGWLLLQCGGAFFPHLVAPFDCPGSSVTHLGSRISVSS